MRAREPDEQGYVDRDGVKIGYEVFGTGDTTVLFVPVDAIVDSRAWKAQVPYLARTCRVVTVDPRGNGRSDRPTDPAAYGDLQYVADTIAVLDALGIERAVLVGICQSAWQALVCAARHPDRVQGVFAIGPWARDTTPPHPVRAAARDRFDDVLDDDAGWAKMNRHYWLRDWPGFAEFFFTQICNEPHSTKLVEDTVGYACQSTAEVQLAVGDGEVCVATPAQGEALLAQVRCPVLVVHGTDDRCQPHARGANIAELTGGRLVTLEGSGHLPQGRDPVRVNLLLRQFVDEVAGSHRPQRWTRALDRRKRVLYLSSPIGLGHARRDLAIVRQLREQRPDVVVDWLTQEPVVTFLESQGEHVHPASSYLASESKHIESVAGEHDLHAFQAIRAMDEVLVANFMVFNELVSEEHYDLWVGDEAWDVDHFLHENPELKRAPFAWLTDFVGWLPMPDGGPAEAALTTDYNAEMVEHIARFPRLRDKALFVGNSDDVVADGLGAGLPGIREWTEEHFEFTGYVTGFDAADLTDRAELRARLGYRDDEKVCIVSVGGSGVGEHLLRRVAESYDAAARLVPGLRMVLVAGPRIDPRSLPRHDGLEVAGFVPDLHRHLAACDIAVVQGGLTTTMELVAAGRPFLYFPLRHHFEQTFHVAHRLRRHRAGRCLDWATADREVIASAIAEELRRTPDYLAVETDGATRAATALSALF
jgi:pimeloyl-ACP methyl ester carboxylesterase/predicted glycosyltransferase